MGSEWTFARLVARCKCSVSLTVNEHRDMYETVEQWLEGQESYGSLDIPADERAKMVATNTVVSLQFYPSTPIGFYHVVGASLEYVMAEAETWLASGDTFRDDGATTPEGCEDPDDRGGEVPGA